MMIHATTFVRAQQDTTKIEDGYTKYHFANGQVSSEGRLVDGRPEGKWKAYYENGRLRSEGDRKDQRLDGAWRFYAENGSLVNEITYAADRKQGPSRRYDTTGTLLSEEFFENDLRAGTARYYHPNGQVHKEVPFKDGKEDGNGLEFADDGRVVALLYYGTGMLRKREEINRLDRAGMKQGPWKEFHPNGKARLEGSYVDDRKHGIFKEFDALGNLKDMVKYDSGALDTLAANKLTVEIKRSFHPNGKVASIGSYSKSGKREGLFKEFSMDGQVNAAKIFQGDQLISEGLVNDLGALEGPWTEYYATGEKRAEGGYEKGRKEGDWTFYHRSGKVEQKGKYLNGLAHGRWQWFYESGSSHREELYRKGKEDGASVELDEAGKTITQGEFIDGRKEGRWTYEVGDHKEVGDYKDGLKDGPWVYTYDNGRKYFTGAFVSGEPNGKQKWYWRNGQVKMEGRYTVGLEQGDFQQFDEQGAPTLVIKYKDGIEVRIDGERVPPPFQAGGGDQP